MSGRRPAAGAPSTGDAAAAAPAAAPDLPAALHAHADGAHDGRHSHDHGHDHHGYDHHGHDHAAARLPPSRPLLGFAVSGGRRLAAAGIAIALIIGLAAATLSADARPAMAPAAAAPEAGFRVRIRAEASFPVTSWRVAVGGAAVLGAGDARSFLGEADAAGPVEVLVDAAGDDDGAAQALRVRIDGGGPPIDRTAWGQGGVVAAIRVGPWP